LKVLLCNTFKKSLGLGLSAKRCSKSNSHHKALYNEIVIYTPNAVPFFRQYIAPIIIFAIFLFTLVLVSSRAFLPSDMVAPAPIGVFFIS
jgi:hypothetical protein